MEETDSSQQQGPTVEEPEDPEPLDKKNEPDNEEVKSRAIVKYSAPKPATFAKLQCNTDLNLPPSNWLSSSADSYGLQRVLYNPKGFSSFRMAHMFPDCVGEVDVVSDAENIKNLLKIPYHKGHISMMVHRIENTLLIDDFDIYKHLLRTAETEWDWLRKFFFEHINRETCEEDRNMYTQSRRREALKQKSLVSKFLYHSLVESDAKVNDIIEIDQSKSWPLQYPLLPEPAPATECPDSQPFDKHNRNVAWTFEDIDMLVGTDMPIFGGGTHPCISLRLRDMSKPISVLTGIDYWLDNLMSNVPEVVMCYHLNGIVQKYELIKTEDLPRLDNSKFSPKLIRDVAQSILSFLKSNATKAGHTYWLFKGKDEEVIKLYDLTSLCSEQDVEDGKNPFTIPVAMLLYRVARNMKHNSERSQPGTIRMLLKNAVKLLSEEKYPEIVTSSHYMLSDLYIPAHTNPESPDFDQSDQEDSDSVYGEDLNDEDDMKDTETKTLALDKIQDCDKFTSYYKPPPPIAGGIEERCLQAINHVAAGLNCLKYFSESRNESREKEEEVPMAKPFEPIPMPYAKLNDEGGGHDGKRSKKKDKNKKREKPPPNPKKEDTNVNALIPKSINETPPVPAMYAPNMSNISWKDHLKTLLYEKVLLTYATLSEYHYVSGNYGTSLRNISLLARCQIVMNKLLYTSNALRENCLLGRAGDCCIMMVQNWNKVDAYREQLQNNIDEDFKMMEQLEKDEQNFGINIANTNMKCVFLYDIRTIEQMLLKATECYEEALKLSETDSILRRLGNGLNEVASFYLNKAKTLKSHSDIIETCKKSEIYLTRGLEIFEKVKDDANVALLYTNMGHLHRLLAHAHTPAERGELTGQEKLHYNKAFVNYKKALQVLGDRKGCPGIWDAVKWELSTALFTMGTIMHEYPPAEMNKVDVEKEVIEILQKALTYCDLDEANPKYPLYQYRAAIIHYRIGSLYHSHILSTGSDSVNRKKIIQLAKIHYEKASKLYFLSNDTVNYFTSQMQRIALGEYLAETTTVLNSKIKHFQHCLDIILELRDMITLLIDKKVDLPEDLDQTEGEDSEKKTYKTLFSLLKLIKTRLQHILKTSVKICLTKPPPNKDCAKLAGVYKSCYKTALQLTDKLDFDCLLAKLQVALKTIDAEVKTIV